MINAECVQCSESVKIARWFNDYQAAVSLRFDDSLESHIKIAVPLLNKYDFKGTFMINPGIERYKRNVDFWEHDLPRMGHRLGNHTMNHRGARTMEEAEYEIGETSKRIWIIYAQYSKLNVFASGGGKKWGGREWSVAEEDYKKIAEKYHLIDLYNGYHASYPFHSKIEGSEILKLIDETMESKSHQAFHFHEVEERRIRNFVKGILYGVNLTIERKQLSDLLGRLNEFKGKIWVAPIIDILKYEEEFKNTKIISVVEKGSIQKISIRVDTNIELYDQPLTLLIPVKKGGIFDKAYQNDKIISDVRLSAERVIINIRPISSEITIYDKS